MPDAGLLALLLMAALVTMRPATCLAALFSETSARRFKQHKKRSLMARVQPGGAHKFLNARSEAVGIFSRDLRLLRAIAGAIFCELGTLEAI